jgi:hypothetical protein
VPKDQEPTFKSYRLNVAFALAMLATLDRQELKAINRKMLLLRRVSQLFSGLRRVGSPRMAASSGLKYRRSSPGGLTWLFLQTYSFSNSLRRDNLTNETLMEVACWWWDPWSVSLSGLSLGFPSPVRKYVDTDRPLPIAYRDACATAICR